MLYLKDDINLYMLHKKFNLVKYEEGYVDGLITLEGCDFSGWVEIRGFEYYGSNNRHIELDTLYDLIQANLVEKV